MALVMSICLSEDSDLKEKIKKIQVLLSNETGSPVPKGVAITRAVDSLLCVLENRK